MKYIRKGIVKNLLHNLSNCLIQLLWINSWSIGLKNDLLGRRWLWSWWLIFLLFFFFLFDWFFWLFWFFLLFAFLAFRFFRPLWFCRIVWSIIQNRLLPWCWSTHCFNIHNPCIHFLLLLNKPFNGMFKSIKL